MTGRRGPPSARRRLLFLSQTLPYPPDGGVKIRTYHILRLLARSFDVTALCFYRSKGGALQTDPRAALEGLASLAKVEAFPIPQELSRLRFGWDHSRSMLTGRVYTVYAYESRAFAARLVALLGTQSFDLVHADSLDLSRYFPLIAPRPLVCVHHDIQSILLARRAGVDRHLARRSYARIQARLMRREEKLWGPRSDLNVVVSEEDAAALRHIAPASRITVVPNGVDTETFTPSSESNTEIAFVGGTTWFPNLDALEYFTAAILPLLRSRGIRAPIRWVGRATPVEIGRFGALGVRMTGHVPDIRPHLRDTGCYVVPIRVGGGTRIKILDAWALGKAVVSTSIGCEGLAAVDGRNILIRDDPSAFADAVGSVLMNSALREQLGTEGRRTAEERYSWDAIEPDMIATYFSLIPDTPPGSGAAM